MRQDKKQSSFNFFKGQFNFTDKDPHWFQLAVIISFFVFVILIVWKLNTLPFISKAVPSISPKEQYHSGNSP
jgi:formate hydrogenlyase subunit 4